MAVVKGFESLKNLREERVTDRISRRILSGDKEMIVWWSMKAGAHAPPREEFLTSSPPAYMRQG